MTPHELYLTLLDKLNVCIERGKPTVALEILDSAYIYHRCHKLTWRQVTVIQCIYDEWEESWIEEVENNDN